MKLLIILWVFLCLIIGVAARDKSTGFFGGFFYSLILSPLIGLIIVIAARDSPQKIKARITAEERLRLQVRQELEAKQSEAEKS